jgi:hypothetical protein
MARFFFHQNYYHFVQVRCQRRCENREINIFAREINIFAREINLLPGETNINMNQKRPFKWAKTQKIPIGLGILPLHRPTNKH